MVRWTKTLQQWLAIGLTAVLCAAACGCSRSSDGSTAPASSMTSSTDASTTPAVVAVGHAVTIGGVTVSRPAGDPVSVSGERPKSIPVAPEGTTVVASGVELATSEPFRGDLTLAWPVPAGVDGSKVLVAFVENGTWTPVATSFDPASNTVSTRTSHLSTWGTFFSDGWGYVARIASAVKKIVGLGDIGEAPRCPSPLPGDVVTIVGENFRLETCSYLSGGQFKLRLANRRAISVVMPRPAGATHTGGSIPGAGDLAAGLIERINDSVSTTEPTELIPSGGWVELTWPSRPSTPVVIRASTNNGALVWSTMFAAVDGLGGGWEALAKVASAGDLGAAIGNTDATEGSRLALTSLLEQVAKGSKGVVRFAASLVGAMVGSVFLAVRGTIDSLRFDSLYATITINPPRPERPMGFGPGCDAVDLESTVCRFMESLRLRDPSSLSALERHTYDVAAANGLAGRSWVSDGGCVDIGDIHYACNVRVQAPDPNIMNLYTVSVRIGGYGDGPDDPRPLDPVTQPYEVDDLYLGPP